MDHTPGPWKVGHSGFERRPSIIGHTQREMRGHKLTPVPLTIAICSDGPVEANARLIAAAPELLDALREIRTWISGWSPSFTMDDEWPATAAKMQAAITKAEAR